MQSLRSLKIPIHSDKWREQQEKHELQYLNTINQRKAKFHRDFSEHKVKVRFDSRPYQNEFYEKHLEELEQKYYEKEEKNRRPHLRAQVMKEYMTKVHDQHLPKISIEKKNEREN